MYGHRARPLQRMHSGRNRPLLGKEETYEPFEPGPEKRMSAVCELAASGVLLQQHKHVGHTGQVTRRPPHVTIHKHSELQEEIIHVSAFICDRVFSNLSPPASAFQGQGLEMWPLLGIGGTQL